MFKYRNGPFLLLADKRRLILYSVKEFGWEEWIHMAADKKA
jgi:hypothetical protein